MKKYLMFACAALALASCSKSDDLYDASRNRVTDTYNAAFTKYVGGNIASNQNWGFGDPAASRMFDFTRAASVGSTAATTNASKFSTWSDQKTYVTCDEGQAVEYQVTYSVDTNHPVTDQIEVLKAYAEVLPEGQNNISKVASTNKEEFVTTAAGEISYIVLPGVTAGTNDRIGYYYYTTSCNIKTLHKYVLTNDPSKGYLGDGSYVNFNDANGNYAYTGWEKKFKTYKLIYVDENGNASYTFPAGVNVGFFTETQEAGSKATVELYSRGGLNKEISEWIAENSTDTSWGSSATNSHVAIFSYKGYNFVGFEDWTDYDYNDMVLSVVGNIQPANTVNIEEDDDDDDDSDATIRIIAEDLSATEDTDFDFNDVVFDVEFTSETSAKITLQAAGGTLPLTVAGEEVHAKFGITDTKTMINTNADRILTDELKAQGYKAVNNVAPVSFDVNGIQKSNWGKDIAIKVQKDGTWYDIDATTGGPAAKICVKTNFVWANEKQSIKARYQQFTEWVRDPSVDWY